MSLRPFLLLLILAGFSIEAMAQVDFVNKFRRDVTESFSHQPKLDLRLDGHNSFVTNHPAAMMGIKGGVAFNRTVRFGLGYSWLTTKIKHERTITGLNGEPFNTDYRLRFRYAGPYFEYTFHRTEKWEFSIPVSLGFGSARYEYRNDVGRDLLTNARTIAVNENGISGQYKIYRYLAVGGGVGFRLMLTGNRGLPDNFSSPIYTLKVKVLAGELYQDIKREMDKRHSRK